MSPTLTGWWGCTEEYLSILDPVAGRHGWALLNYESRARKSCHNWIAFPFRAIPGTVEDRWSVNQMMCSEDAWFPAVVWNCLRLALAHLRVQLIHGWDAIPHHFLATQLLPHFYSEESNPNQQYLYQYHSKPFRPLFQWTVVAKPDFQHVSRCFPQPGQAARKDPSAQSATGMKLQELGIGGCIRERFGWQL